MAQSSLQGLAGFLLVLIRLRSHLRRDWERVSFSTQVGSVYFLVGKDLNVFAGGHPQTPVPCHVGFHGVAA